MAPGTHIQAADTAAETQQTSIHDLPNVVLLDILVRSGAWTEEVGQKLGRFNGSSDLWDMPIVSALSGCRQWRADLMASEPHIAELLTSVHGGSRRLALERACAMGHEAACTYLLQLPEGAPRADEKRGRALQRAAEHSHLNIVKMLLTFPKHAPRADVDDGIALVFACDGGFEDIARLLLEFPRHPPRVDCGALVAAVYGRHAAGNEAIVRLLLEFPGYVSDGSHEQALVAARAAGNDAIVRMIEAQIHSLEQS
ncbi:hypothetical protein FOA52_001060 [Chlamydomonas sp. UWO 241]|nr:hypothetical protein FOA52_001060 [Chlamydomonas sp. UWO 241]